MSRRFIGLVQGSGTPGTVTNVSGTANQIDVATGTTTPVISLDAAINLPGSLTVGTGASIGVSGTGTVNATSFNGNTALSGNNPQTSTYQVLASDFSGYKTITVASGTFTITLVASGTQPANGQYIRIINYGAGTITIAVSGQNINGAVTSLALPPPTNAQQPTEAYIESDGSNYFASIAGANSTSVGGKTFAIPNPIGITTPNSGAFTTLNAGTAKFTVNASGLPTLSNNITLAGQGYPLIAGVTSQKVESAADATVLSVTPAAAVGTYRVSIAISVSAATAATLGWTATWTDSNGNPQTPTNLAIFQSGIAAPALTLVLAAAGNLYGDAIIDVNNAATAIVVKLTFAGTSFTAKVSATVERLI